MTISSHIILLSDHFAVHTNDFVKQSHSVTIHCLIISFTINSTLLMHRNYISHNQCAPQCYSATPFDHLLPIRPMPLSEEFLWKHFYLECKFNLLHRPIS